MHKYLGKPEPGDNPQPAYPLRSVDAGDHPHRAYPWQAVDAGDEESSGETATWWVLFIWLISQFFDYAEGWTELAPEVLGVNLSPDRVLFVFVLAALGWRIAVTWGQAPLNRYAAPLMAAFFLLCMVSAQIAGSDAAIGRNRWLVTILQLTVYPFCTYLLVRRLPWRPQRARQLLTIFLVMGVYYAWIGIAEHYDLRWLVWPQYILDPSIGLTPGRARGPLLNTADMGWVLLGGVAVCWLRYPRATELGKMVLLGLAGLSTIATYFTYTRGSWLAFAFGLATLGWFRRREIGGWVVVVLLLVVVLLPATGIASKLSWSTPTLFGTRQQTVDYRKLNMLVAWEIIKSNPLIGVGYGNFGNNLRRYSADAGQELRDGNHNLFLGLAAEIGVLGLLLYLVIFLVLWRELRRLQKRMPDDDIVLRDLVDLTVVMMLAFFLSSQLGDWRFHLLPHNYLFILFGLAAAASRDHVFARSAPVGTPAASSAASPRPAPVKSRFARPADPPGRPHVYAGPRVRAGFDRPAPAKS